MYIKHNSTPYLGVNRILDVLLSHIQQILKDQFVGMYLYGSLALDDFDTGKSDIDFLVVTNDEIRDESKNKTLSDLIIMHKQISSINSKWSKELEGSYISRDAIRRYNQANSTHPHIDRGNGLLKLEKHDSDWVIQRYVLREYGIVLSGPSPKELIDPIASDDLREAIKEFLWWWELQLSDTSRVQKSDYQVYAILTMCRILYTFNFGTIVSKPTAARWAQNTIDSIWANLIEQALLWQPGTKMNYLEEALGFIKYALKQCKSRP